MSKESIVTQQVNHKIQKADPGVRRNAILVTTAAGAVGLALVVSMDHFSTDIATWVESGVQENKKISAVVSAVVMVLVAPILFASAYLFLLGRRTVSARRYPPPGVAVIRDTPVVEGNRSLVRGRIIQVLAIVLTASSLVLPLLVWRLFQVLVG